MALIKAMDTNYGIQGNYWRINQIDYMPKSIVYCSAELFISKEARNQGKHKILHKIFEFPPPANPDTNIIQYCYNQIKLTEDFNGSQDD